MIDLRSDTVTQPCAGMRQAMFSAETGDDVYGEDPTVKLLEERVAQLSNKDAGLFVTSGTQGNLVAILSHCERGHEYIAGTEAHTYLYEGGGAAVLGGIQPCTIPFNKAGELPLDIIKCQLKPDDSHYAISRLLCLENTQAGRALSLKYLSEFSRFALNNNLKRHLDGARVFNAAIKLGVTLEEICSNFDTISICLSKGLGAPMGSVVVGDHQNIANARRWRKMLGGGLRQAGIAAAAGIYALDHNVFRLKDDHRRAQILANSLQDLGMQILEKPQTNMVMLHPEFDPTGLQKYLETKMIKISGHRLVTHKDVSDHDLETVISSCKEYLNG